MVLGLQPRERLTKVEGFMLPCPTSLLSHIQQVNAPLQEALLDCSLSQPSPAVQDRLFLNPGSASYRYDILGKALEL